MAEQVNEDEAETLYETLTGTQKSAILMMLLGEEEASEILRNLSPREVQHLGSAMYSVQGLDQDTVNRVLDEFLAIIKEQTSLGLGADNGRLVDVRAFASKIALFDVLLGVVPSTTSVGHHQCHHHAAD